MRRPLKVYVAASSKELARAKRVMSTLRAAGVHVTSTWPEGIEAAGAANEGLTLTERRIAGGSCEAQVEESDVLLLLVPLAPSGIGSGWEAGFARALGLHVIASGPTERSVFCALVAECPEDDYAVREIIALARRTA